MQEWKQEGYLDRMRQEMDPLADDAVKALFEAPEGVLEGFTSLFRRDLMPGGSPPAGVPEAMRQYLVEQAKPPVWQEQGLLDIGERVQSSHGILTLSILACASLPECYVDWRGMPVLALTQQLAREDVIGRRVVETCLYVNQVLSSDGFEAGGLALDATRKVRLMHAAARYLILAKPDVVRHHLPADVAERFNAFDDGYWAREGNPINQEDLAYTLQTFSWVAVRGLRTLKLGLDAREEEGIIHCWRVAGHHMGIREELLPDSVNESREMFDFMKARLADYEPGDPKGNEGKELTQALLTWTGEDFLPRVMGILDEVKKDRSIVTLEKLKPLGRMLMWYLVGAETAAKVGITEADFTAEERRRGRAWLRVVTWIARIREWGLDRIPGFRTVSNWVFQAITGLRWNRLGFEDGKIPFTRPVGHWTDKKPAVEVGEGD